VIPTPRIEFGDADDLTEIMDIEMQSFVHPYSMATFRNYLDRKESCVLVGRIDHQLAGYIIVDVKPGAVAVIVSIAVRQGYRRKGLGSLLLDSALEMVRGKAKGAQLQVSVRNEEAVSFYRNRGFRIAGILPSYYPDGIDAFFMIRPIS